MIQTIKPLSGFPELLPEEQLLLNHYITIVKRNFELFGFSPIETPAVERKTTLISKGGDEKEIYSLSRLSAEAGANSETEMALHFDLTVPLARYVAMYKNQLTFPFRRYQIQKVWRGERAQAGRYREFYQCDIDVVGQGDLPIMYDAEMPAIIYSIFEQFKLGPILIRINNRKVLGGYLETLGLSTNDRVTVLRSIDKIEKVERAQLVSEIVSESTLEVGEATNLLEVLSIARSVDETLEMLKVGESKSSLLRDGLFELVEVVDGIRQLGVPDDSFVIDLSVVRGLDYYTGTVYETKLIEHPELGSVCSGGRYDDLAGLFTNEKMPGVGISIGLTRLVVALLRKGVLKPVEFTPAKVLVTAMDSRYTSDYLVMGARLRSAGIATEVYFDSRRPIKAQLKYANRKGFQYVLIMGETEKEKGVVQVKNMTSGDFVELTEIDLIGYLIK